MTPISAKKTNAIEMLAALKRRLRNTLTSSIGWSVWRSQAMNAAMIAAPAAKAARMIGLLQPCSGASIRAQMTALRPAIDRPVPGRSSLGESGSRESGTSAKAPIRHAATTGRLIRKMLLESKCSSRKPPEIGPIATPSPDTAAQMAIAFGRSFDGKMFVRIDSVVGMIPAAPRPMSAREAMSMVASVERAASDGPEREHHQPGRERAPAPEAITEAARGEQQAREHQHVAVDDPLQLARARVELLADAWQTDVEDRVAHRDHEQAEREHAQRLPAARIRLHRGLLRGNEGAHGITTSVTRVTVERWATKNGSCRTASSSLAASTVHQIAWPPSRHEASAARWRSGLSWPLKAVNATPHWCGSWR